MTAWHCCRRDRSATVYPHVAEPEYARVWSARPRPRSARRASPRVLHNPQSRPAHKDYAERTAVRCKAVSAAPRKTRQDEMALVGTAAPGRSCRVCLGCLSHHRRLNRRLNALASLARPDRRGRLSPQELRLPQRPRTPASLPRKTRGDRPFCRRACEINSPRACRFRSDSRTRPRHRLRRRQCAAVPATAPPSKSDPGIAPPAHIPDRRQPSPCARATIVLSPLDALLRTSSRHARLPDKSPA